MAEVDIRGDKVVIYKQGGFAELQIKNATASLVGGFLKNIGGGLTEWDTVAAAQSWDDTLAIGNTTARQIFFTGTGPLINITSPNSGVNIIEQAITHSATNLASFQRQLENSSAGGPPDDNVYIQGWNIDSTLVNTLPSFTSRMEYRYTGSFYEYHDPEWRSADGSRLYRLQSFTLQDHGGIATDSCLTYFTGTGFEFRNLSGQVFLNSGSDYTTGDSALVFRNATSSFGIQFETLQTSNQIYMVPWPNGSVYHLVAAGWDTIDFGSSVITTTGALICTNYHPASGGSAFNFVSNGNDLTTNWMYNHPGLFFQTVSNNTGEYSFRIPPSGGYYFQFIQGSTGIFTMTPSTATFSIPVVATSLTTGEVLIAASTTSRPQMNLAVGSAPTSPADGDIWLESNTNTGLKMRINGVTKTVSLV